ncbi:MAG: capsule assembly Wzi family protein, partial [Deltaproteobacteria bacterium]|nr:capsule assembly Wzi family protein [Deltaproteobacteria bacterium]
MTIKAYFILFILIVTFYGHVHAAYYYSDLDFWRYEHLENKELRGGKSVQLNTKPLLVNTSDDKRFIDEGSFYFGNIRTEFHYSSFMPLIEQQEGIWTTRGNNYQIQAELSILTDDFTLWMRPSVSYHQNSSLEAYPEGRYMPISYNHKNRYPSKEGSFQYLSFQASYILLPFNNWYFFMGKDSLRFGSGKHDSLHLSNSSKPFPMFRFGTLSPGKILSGDLS